MKVKVGEIVNVYPVIMKSSFAKMNGKAKLGMVRIIKAMKPVASEFEEVRQDAIKKLAGEDYQEAIKKVQNPKDYSEDEVKEALNVAKTSDDAYSKFVQEECEKEVEVEFELLKEDDFESLLEGSKDLTPQELMMLSELICE